MIAGAAVSAVALALLAFFAADGVSYLTDAPEACSNCHVMRSRYVAWQTSAHAQVAVCNDCHVPVDPIDRLATKARSGIAHSLALLTRSASEPIRIRPASRAIARASCERCHAGIAGSAEHGGVPREERDCVACHPGVGHPADRRGGSS